MGFSPERLKDIRIKHGHTTAFLAEKCNVSKQAVSKYETGQAIPSADVLRLIVEVYALPAGYLTKENMLPAERTDVFYRKNDRTPNKELEGVRVRLKWLYEILMAAGQIYPLQPVKIPFLGNFMLMEEKAQALRRVWGLGDGPIDDLAVTLEKNGFYLFTARMGDVKIDGYSQLIGRYPIIILNQDRGSLARKNFSLAHELGHLIMHIYEKFDGEQEKEEQADEFAGCFLLPEITFRKDVQDLMRINAESVKVLGQKWHVSPHAVVERCFKLNMLGKNPEESNAHRQSLLQRFNKKDYYMAEEMKICSLQNILLKIDADRYMRREFLDSVRLPVREIQDLCQIPMIFGEDMGATENVDDMDGIQLSLVW